SAPSIDSNSSWSSTLSNCGSDPDPDCGEEYEVSSFLLSSDEESTTPSPSSDSGSPDADGPLFLQLLYCIMQYYNVLPNHPFYPLARPTPSVRISSQSKTIPKAAGSCTFYSYFEELIEEDDAEYLVPPTSGTDEEVLRIPVLNANGFREKIKNHSPDMLRIYRMPYDDISEFGVMVRRLPDVFDTISVVRQGHVSWDLGGKDETWMLIGNDPFVIEKILSRCDRRKPPFMTRTAYKVVAPWLPSWVLY
ncbi:hypothetical protein BDZ97DRAFT_1795362, partial [Flammula alnicola]